MKYMNLIRIKHYIKNFLIFLPLFFNNSLFNFKKTKSVFIGFILFSFISSCVYIINDIQDISKDAKNPYKKRPIASGEIKINTAIIILIILLICSLLLSFKLHNLYAILCLLIYFMMNVFYSFGLKNIPIIDITILVSGFIIRILYGGIVANIQISNWLYLTVFSFSFFFALCKRRNELRTNLSTKRNVLIFYNDAFLDKNMYMFLGMAIIFYALWSIDIGIKYMVWTVPLISIISMRYSLIIEQNSYGDPVEVILTDKTLLLLGVFYALILYFLIY